MTATHLAASCLSYSCTDPSSIDTKSIENKILTDHHHSIKSGKKRDKGVPYHLANRVRKRTLRTLEGTREEQYQTCISRWEKLIECDPDTRIFVKVAAEVDSVTCVDEALKASDEKLFRLRFCGAVMVLGTSIRAERLGPGQRITRVLDSGYLRQGGTMTVIVKPSAGNHIVLDTISVSHENEGKNTTQAILAVDAHVRGRKSKDFQFVSDRKPCINEGIKLYHPACRVSDCLTHMKRNLKELGRATKEGCSSFLKMAYADESDFQKILNEFNRTEKPCSQEYMGTLVQERELWADAFFDGEREDIRTNQLAESYMSAALKKGIRKGPMVEVFERAYNRELTLANEFLEEAQKKKKNGKKFAGPPPGSSRLGIADEILHLEQKVLDKIASFRVELGHGRKSGSVVALGDGAGEFVHNVVFDDSRACAEKEVRSKLIARNALPDSTADDHVKEAQSTADDHVKEAQSTADKHVKEAQNKLTQIKSNEPANSNGLMSCSCMAPRVTGRPCIGAAVLMHESEKLCDLVPYKFTLDAEISMYKAMLEGGSKECITYFNSLEKSPVCILPGFYRPKTGRPSKRHWTRARALQAFLRRQRYKITKHEALIAKQNLEKSLQKAKKHTADNDGRIKAMKKVNEERQKIEQKKKDLKKQDMISERLDLENLLILKIQYLHY